MSAEVTVVFDVVSTPATSVSFAPVTPPTGGWTTATAVGTVLGQITVAPSDWNGTLTLSGALAGVLTVNGTLQLVTSGALPVGDGTATTVIISAAP